MRIFRPKVVKLDGAEYEVHIDQTVYVRRNGLRRVKDHELARRVVDELRRQAAPPALPAKPAPVATESPRFAVKTATPGPTTASHERNYR